MELRKIKIYLDTSVLSYLEQIDAPYKTAETLELWDVFRTRDDVEILISNIALEEFSETKEPKRSRVLDLIGTLAYKRIQETDEHRRLAQVYLDANVLTGKSFEDLRHIAVAVSYGCKYIVSWNFKHFVNPKTIDAVNAVSLANNLPQIQILSPSMLLGGF
ncbi:MAG: PIN domain nuclease [Oscillospiraceae bacterium]|jgi:predicted nucleic acid-binding protein|nr:PIN domain nuclease [Oscillospiraceae bacterium]